MSYYSSIVKSIFKRESNAEFILVAEELHKLKSDSIGYDNKFFKDFDFVTTIVIATKILTLRPIVFLRLVIKRLSRTSS